jgi:diguanylate cyclase (GGDEF)-like protein
MRGCRPGFIRKRRFMSAPRGPFRFKVFAAVALAAALILLTIVLVPQWLSKQARLEVLRSHVAEIARLAASVVDGNLHRELLDSRNYSAEKYDRVLAPLVRFHLASPQIFYVYTMMARGGETYFVLDTTSSTEIAEKSERRPSKYMEHFNSTETDASQWLQRLARGETWVYPDFQHDEYGYFLTGHTPIYDSQGRYSGFVGVDFDLDYYLAQERRFHTIFLGSILAALAAALVIGALIASYHRGLEQRILTHYESSVRDELTGLLNRRGAMEAINKSLALRERSYCTLVIDIDDLKLINDTEGHAVGDAAIISLAATLRDSVRDRDLTARLGGDEFLVFAPNCDRHGAHEIAHRILERAEAAVQEGLPRYSVSIGICANVGGTTDFDSMYRRADEALYRAKAAGKNRLAACDEPVPA